jgi:signal transduction histidine kinase
MTASNATSAAPVADRNDFVSLTERLHWLNGLRAAFGLAVVAVATLVPEIRTESLSAIAAYTAAYVAVSLLSTAAIRTRRGRALVVIAATLLLDGIYLAWVAYATGGLLSPLRYLILAHIAAVTLAASHRTGFKIAAWHSLLLFASSYAQSSEILTAHETAIAALPGGQHFWLLAMLSIGANLAIAVVTAAFSSVNERELRAQKVDLDELSSMVRRLDASTDGSEISRVLLDELARVFGFTRGAVLASPEGDLTVLASREAADGGIGSASDDATVRRALAGRDAVLVHALDASADPALASILPDARNVVVVPMHLSGGVPLGIVVLEYPGGRIKRWVVRLVEQYVAHAALSLRNTWLFNDLQRELIENEALRRKLVAYNETLEAEVQERTRELNQRLSDLRIADDEKRRLLGRLVDAQEAERLRVAHDIHDAPLQNMAATSMRLQLLRNRMKDDPESAAMLDKLFDTVRSTMRSMRHMIFELRPTVLDEEGVGEAIVQYLETTSEGLVFDVDDRLTDEPPQELRVILYRITQEALANVRKHAQAGSVQVVLEERDGGYLVSIEDDGVGFDPPEMLRSAPGHLGLSAMRERAEMVGGRCTVRSRPGSGTRVEFWLPASASEEGAPSELSDPIDSLHFLAPASVDALDPATSIVDRQPEVV